MPISHLGRTPTVSDSLLVRATWISLGAAALLSAIWLWCCWCSFPGIPWNDIRVAPAVAWHHGISIYSLPASGPVSTWIYGPLPLLLMWPAGLAPGAIGAIEIAGAIHIGLKVLTLALACWFWPAAQAPAAAAQDWQRRLAAALLCVLLVRNDTSGYLVYSADAPGVAFGLLSLLALARRQYWLAAACAAASASCKQTLVGVGLAQLIWLFATVSPQAAWRHLGRCVVAGSVAAMASASVFGVAGLWHTMFEIPAGFPWAGLAGRLEQHAVYLLLHVVLPIVAMVVGRRFFFSRTSPVLLPSLAFFCTLPLGVAGLLKIGGNVNSLHSFWLWFPPTLIALATGERFGRLGQKGILAASLATVAVASLWLQTSNLRVLPNVQAYREATYLAARLPEKIWFPLHPIVTLYSDGRFYHDLDGICERRLAGQPLGPEHFLAHTPRRRQASATLLPVGWGLSEISDRRLPENAPVTTFGLWRIDGRLE